MKRNFLLTSLIAFALVLVVGCGGEKPTTVTVRQIGEDALPKSLEPLELKPDLNRGRLVINEATLAKMGADGVPGNVLEALRNMEGRKSFNSADEFAEAVKSASPDAEKFMDRILGNALVTELEDDPEPPQMDMVAAMGDERADPPPPPPGEKPFAMLAKIDKRAPPPGPPKTPPPTPIPPPWPGDAFGTVLFDFDKSAILSRFKEIIKGNAAKLLDNPSRVATIEGHADERGTNEYNLALGQRRAEAIRDALIEFGVPPSQLQTLTFGEERPANLGHTEKAWRLNRRGEMVESP